MVDIKCPMCGKNNPPDKEICQYCQARIKPLFPNMNDDELSKLLGLDKTTAVDELSEEIESDRDHSMDWLDQIGSEQEFGDVDHSAGAEKELDSQAALESEPSSDFDDAEELDGESAAASQDFHSEDSVSWNIDGKDTPESDAEVQNEIPAANLPSWLEAMRPVDPYSTLDEKAEPDSILVEAAGPLAGLKGVIPAEPDASVSHKPFKISVKLQVSEHQQAHAALLEQLIRSEGKAPSLSKKELVVPKNFLRTGIAFILILSVFLTYMLPASVQMNAPSLANYSSAWAAHRVIDGIGSERPVLLAVDYQPGTSGEMDAVTGAVLKHLISQNAKLVLVTTQPFGSMQAERLISRSSQETGIAYRPTQNYANLGYIPGGYSGILSFMSDPRRNLPMAAIGSDAWTSDIWQQPSFQMVKDITSFSLVIVATENTDTARIWIEQLSSFPIVSPLVMAVSAQVEPVVAPYYQAVPAQVQGIIPGLAGATAYESVTYSPGAAIQAYSSFSIVGILAVVIILLGSLINAFSVLMEARQQQQRSRGDGK
jgi:hypothetical protein